MVAHRSSAYQRTLTESEQTLSMDRPRYGVAEAECIWSQCLARLRMLFLPDVRYSELGRLAKD